MTDVKDQTKSGMDYRIAQWVKAFLPRPILNLIYRRQARSYIRSLKPSFDLTKKTILAINHFYDQDLRALELACTDYNFVVVDGPRLARGAKLFFPDDVIQLNARYEKAPETDRLSWRFECRLMFEQLNERFHIGLILLPSDTFWWVRELVTVGHEHGVKTVVIDKEGIISPYDFDAAASRIAQMAPFISDHIFVWSDRQKLFWNKIGVSDDMITILGQPRSDLFHVEKPRDVDALFGTPRPIVTFFSYMADAYIPIDAAVSEKLTWGAMREQTHNEVYRLAEKFASYNFVIKAHPQQPDIEELRARYERDNLRVIGGSAVANELIQRSELIIAFQTTALIEAMFMGRRIIYTYWSELLPRFEKDLLPFHDAPGIYTAKSFAELRRVCEQFIAGDTAEFEFSSDVLSRRSRFVDEYLYRPDGNVCRRFFEMAGRFVK